ncbi:MAG: tRNA pseudouridine(55) synthase TruB, partial [Clostridiales bacterium]|nr:tRNA pseudouridine(55) synthase TruB [Clostridiales bacterium]
MYHGILNVYKEKGYTSFDVVAKLRGICGQKKIGHTGTLDPDAEGVLPVCLGRATKVCDLLTDRDKAYRTVMLLGVETDTQDMSGQILSECSTDGITETMVRNAIRAFVGEIEQIPPMYSALKVDGKKLCDLARAGETVERQPRKITIYNIDIERIDLPRVMMSVRCSKGTYI